MASAVFRKVFASLALLGAVAASPAAAQLFSDGYEFLKAVKDRDGDTVTQALNEPGSVIVNTRDISSGESALHIVTKRRDVTWIKFLTAKGANPNIRDKRGVTPLQIATSLGFAEGAEALIKAGADVDESNVAGETPLIAAVHRRDVALVRLLLANGANPDRSDNSGRTARDYVQLTNSNTQLLKEFEDADAERASAGEQKNYGPSF